MTDREKPGLLSRMFGRPAPKSDRVRARPSIRVESTPETRVEGDLPKFSRSSHRTAEENRQAERARRLRKAFTPSHPVARADVFAGRRPLLERIIHLIENQQLHIVLYGDRGIGKTSIMRVVAELAQNAEYRVSYASCGSDSTFDALVRGFASDIPLLYHASYEPTDADVEEGRTLANLFGDRDLTVAEATGILQKVQGARFLFMVDEFDRVMSPRVREQIAELIKNLSDRGTPIQFFIAGVASNLDALISHIPSIRRNLIGMPVGLLDHDETLQLVTLGAARSGIAFSDRALGLVADWSRGLPYLAQLLGLHASFATVQRGGDEVDGDDVRKAVKLAEEEIGLRMSQDGREAIAAALAQHGIFAMRHLANRILSGDGNLVERDIAFLDARLRASLFDRHDDGQQTYYAVNEEAAVPYIWLLTRNADSEAANVATSAA